jgi:DNA-binding GntR family transcriptional regulator
MATSTTTKQSSLVTVKRQVLRDEVREAIISAILTGEFQPGDRIVESRVARELGVSQATIREALREIEQLGMITSHPNRGVTVRPLTRRDVLEMYEMRALLEGYGAGLAAARVTDADLAELAGLVDEMVQIADAGDMRTMIERDVAFHARICTLADHALLTRLWSSVHPHLWTYVAVSGLINLDLEVVARRHSDIVEALRSRDPERAEQAMRVHLLELRERAARSERLREREHSD